MAFDGKPPGRGAQDRGRGQGRGDRDRHGRASSRDRTKRGKRDGQKPRDRDQAPWHQGGGHGRSLNPRRREKSWGEKGQSRDERRQQRFTSRGGEEDRSSRGQREPRKFQGPQREFRGQDTKGRRREPEERRVPKPGTARAHDEPSVPKDFDESSLPVNVRAELKSLPKDLAATVGGHILAAGELLDVDPELAHRHAEAAKRRAGRLPVVREAAAEAAYVSGHYDIALREFRAIRRMSGGDELLPVLADCERALGRHREALELLATLDPRTKKLGLRIECILVEAGIRADLGQRGEALRLLKSAISHRIGPRPAQARLHYAYADLLEAEGRSDAAREWFESAASLDLDGRLDATDRIAALDGITLPEDFETEDPAEKTDPEDEMETQVIDVTAPPAGAVVKRVAPGGRQDEAEEEGAPHRTPAADDAAGTVPARRESAVPYQRDLLISPEEEIAEILSEIDGDGR